MKLIIGLGNPGNEYKKTRHNLGFMALDEYAKKHLGPKISWQTEKKFKAEIIKLPDLILVKPQTFMNLSGITVKAMADFYKIPLSNLAVIYDDLDLPVGKIKIRVGGSSGGHHGVESIINTLGDEQFTRVRLGIGNLPTLSSEHKGAHVNVEHFVLEEFNPTEKPKIKQMIKHSVEALDLVLKEGVEVAQNTHN